MATHPLDTLTEREKQTLRLLLVGHDAKSMARHLGLSVHTVNERLRDARRKLSVSSSREAARLLFEHERGHPQNLGDGPIGDADVRSGGQQGAAPDPAPRSARRTTWALGGYAMIAVFAALLALSTPGDAPAPAAASAAAQAARSWLGLVDACRWQASWAGTGRSFRSANTVAAWQSASEKARVPLGRVLSRVLVDEQDTPAPPHGYRTVRFRTDYANKSGATETLSLVREDDAWKVAGIYIE